MRIIGAAMLGIFLTAAASDLEVRVPVAPSMVPADDGRILVYELELIRRREVPSTIRSLEVIDPDTSKRLAFFEGSALAARTASGTSVTASTRIYVELPLSSDADPRRLQNQLVVEAPDGQSIQTAAVTRVDRTQLLSLSPPLGDETWVAVHSADWPQGHRRVVYGLAGHEHIPGRYAIDWMSVDAAGHTTNGDPDDPRASLGYGAEVHAGVDAVVAAVRDGMADGNSIHHNPKHAVTDAAGNYVALRADDRRFVFYEHLQIGSVKVTVGQHVRRGQILGSLGFSGDSTGPHLHLHVADGLDPVNSEGIPFVISRYCQIGRYDDIDQLGQTPWQQTSPHLAHNLWPGYNVVVRFTHKC